MSTGRDELLMAVVDYDIEHPEFDELSDIGDGQHLCSVAADLIQEMRREVDEKQEQIFDLEEQLAEEKAARERAENRAHHLEWRLDNLSPKYVKCFQQLNQELGQAQQRIEQLEAQIEKARELVQQWCHEATEADSSFEGVWLTVAANELEAILAQSQEADEPEALPLSSAPCDCYELIDGFYVNRCDCGNSGDYGAMEVWCHEMNKAAQESGDAAEADHD